MLQHKDMIDICRPFFGGGPATNGGTSPTITIVPGCMVSSSKHIDRQIKLILNIHELGKALADGILVASKRYGNANRRFR